MNQPLDGALDLAHRGFSVIPVPFKEKGPRIKAWQTLRLSADDLPRYFNGRPMNMGIMTGEPSGNLVDIDLDCPEAVKLASRYLPPTGAIFGRESNPRSHWLYRVKTDIDTTRHKDPHDGTTIIEIRGIGAQTVAPGSVHPSGEAVRWDEGDEPAVVDADELRKAVEAIYRAVLRKRGRPIPEADPNPPLPAGTRHTATTATIQATDDPKVIDRAAKYLDRCEPAISGQGGHGSLLYAACRLVNGFALTEDAALALLRDRYNPRCVPPWSDAELLHKVQEAGKIAHNEPRGHLLNDDRPEVSRATASTGSTQADRPKQAPASLIVRNFADIEREEIDYLWHGVIACRKLTMFAGDPGLGKSFLTCDLAARVSSGRDFPCGMANPNGPGRVLMLNCEDDAGDTIKGRLEDAGANVALVDWIDGAKVGERDQGFQIDAHLDLLEAYIREHPDTRLVTIDPVTAFGGDKDADKNHDVRALLRPLQEMAMRTGVAVVIVSHFNKSSGASKAYRTNGSIGWTAAVRMAWGFAADPDDESRRIMFPIKSNIAANDGGFAFTIAEDDAGRVALAWEPDRVTVNADELLQPSTGREMSEAMAEAVAFLQTELAHGSMRSKDLYRAARDAGISEATLRRAKDKAGVIADKDKGTLNGVWRWMLAPKALSKMPTRQNLSAFGSDGASSGFEGDPPPEDDQGDLPI